jgi:hypothetical protein
MSDENEEDPIGKALNLQPINEIKNQIQVAIDVNGDDVSHARTNIRDLIYKGTSSLEDLLDVARASEHPRAYEVAANFLKTLVDANKDLAELKFKEDKVNLESSNKSVDNRSINNFFVGSTTELLKMMKNAKTIESDE